MNRQSGFAHSGCFSACYMTAGIRENKFTAAAFLDVSKAFDCVNHNILLSQLVCYGVLDDSLVWFVSYFDMP